MRSFVLLSLLLLAAAPGLAAMPSWQPLPPALAKGDVPTHLESIDRLPEGSVKMALGDAYQLWLNSPERRVVDVDHIVFDPTMTKDPAIYINTFEGLPLEPVRDDAACENLRWLISFLCNNDAEALDWLVKWLAYPLQHPGAKMRTSVIMHGDEQLGTSDLVGGQYGTRHRKIVDKRKPSIRKAVL